MSKEIMTSYRQPQVKNILAGLQTQHRVPMRVQPDHFHRDIIGKPKPWAKEDFDRLIPQIGEKEIKPKYQPGDIMCVKETLKTGNHPHENFCYLADGEVRYPENQTERAWLWKHTHSQTIQSNHMPKWACRIKREVLRVTVEKEDGIWYWVTTFSKTQYNG
jgi:hypothetical protein